MHDIILLVLLATCVGAALLRPWLGVLALTFIGYAQPQRYADGFVQDIPFYLIVFISVCLSIIKSRKISLPVFDWRIVVLLTLWAYFLLTTIYSVTPGLAWPKFYEVSKVFISLALTLILINDREKLLYLLVVIALSFGILAVKGGYWAIISGFSDRVYGPPDSHFYGNNMFAVVTIMNIPLLLLWLRETNDRPLRYIIKAIIALSVASAISSWSRGGLITLGITSLALLWHYKKRTMILIPIILVAGLTFSYVLPDPWFERMGTIINYQEDQSAMNRIEAWQSGLEYVKRKPLLGAGFDGWHFVAKRDWHNSYIEILAEHGLIAFTLWSTLLIGSIISLTRLTRQPSVINSQNWIHNYSSLLRASLLAYATGSLFLGLSYWDIFYHLVIITTLISRFARQEINIHTPSCKTAT